MLDQIILERQRLSFVVDDDVIEIGNFADQRTGLGIGPARFEEVRPHTRAQGARFADIKNRAQGVLEKVHAGLRGQLCDFFREFHVKIAMIAEQCERNRATSIITE